MPAPSPGSEEHRKALELVVRRKKSAAARRQPYEEKWLEAWKAYNCFAKKRDDGLANLFIPEIFSTVETIVPRIVEALFATHPYVEVSGREGGDHEAAMVMSQLLDYQFDRVGIVEKFVDFIRECVILGTAVAKVPYRLERRQVIRRQPVTVWHGDVPVSVVQPMRVWETTHDNPEMDHIDLWDFWWDPYARSIEEARCVIHRSWRDVEYLKRMAEMGVYSNVDEVLKADRVEPGRSEERGVTLRLSAIGMGGDEPQDPEDAEVELWEYWEDDRVITVANQRVVLRDDPNPFDDKRKPFFAIRNYTRPHEFPGVGEVEHVIGLNYELNTLRNQRINFLNTSINIAWKMLSGADIDENELKITPGKVIHVDTMESIERVDMPTIDSAVFQDDHDIREAIQNASGVFDYAKGESPGRAETAEAVRRLQQVAEMRFRLKIRLFEYAGLRELARFFVARNQQFMDRAQVIRITGSAGISWATVSPEDIQGEFDYRPAGSGVEPEANKQAKQERWSEMYGQLRDDPYIEPIELRKRYLEVHDVDDPERLLQQPPPPLLVPGGEVMPDAALGQGAAGAGGGQPGRGAAPPPRMAGGAAVA